MTLTANQTTILTGDNDLDGIADTGDTVLTTVVITNTDAVNAVTGVSFTEGIGAQLNGMTQVGDANASPLALNDAYALVGNTSITVNAAQGLMANDAEFLGATFGTGTAQTHLTTTGTHATANGSITINADGSFTYTPNAGFTGTDTFTYTLRDAGLDGDFGNGDDLSDTGTVSFTVDGLVWFIDNTAPGSLNLGTQDNPFTSIAAFNAANNGVGTNHPDANDTVYLRAGTYSEADGVNLLNGQKLIGQGENLVVTHSTLGSVTVETGSTGLTPIINASAGDGIDLASGNTIRGLSINNTSGADLSDNGNVGTLTISNVSLTGTGQAIEIDNGGTLNVQLNSVATTSSGAQGIELAGVGGTFSVTGAISISGTAGAGIDIQNSAANSSFTFSGSSDVINTGAQTAVNFVGNNATSSLTFSNGGLDIDTTTGVGFNATGGGAVTVSGSGNSINATGATAINLSAVTVGGGGITFDSTSSGGGARGINVDTVTGGAISLGTGTLSGHSAAEVDINGGSSAVSYGGTIGNGSGLSAEITNHATGAITLSGNINDTNDSGGGISVIGNTSGTITFSGSTKTLNTGASDAVTLTNNTGAAINFTGGGLDIDTTTGRGFNVSGGGTVTVQGSGNTINSGASTALNISNTNIGAADVTFESISANGGAKGIVLNTTGAAGGLHVTGVGTTDGSGGTIQNIGTRGIELINTADVSIKNVNLTNANTTDGISLDLDISGANGALYMSGVSTAAFDNINISGTTADNGITGLNVSNFSLANSTITQAGNAANESGIEFSNLSGTSSITNTDISFSQTNSVDILNTDVNLNLTLNNVILRDTQTVSPGGADNSIGEGGFQFRSFSNAAGAPVTNIDIVDSDFLRLRTQAIQVFGDDDSAVNLDVVNNVIDAWAGAASSTTTNIGVGIDLNAADGSQFAFNIIGNTIKSRGGAGINVTAFSGGDIEGRINNNSIAVDSIGSGIRILPQETGSTAIVEARNNSITMGTGNNSSSIDVQARFNNARLDLTLDGNTLNSESTAVADINIVAGSSAGAGPEAPETNQVYVNIINNNVVAGGPTNVLRLRVSEIDNSADPRIFLQGFVEAGPGLDDDAVATWNANGNTPIATAASVNVSLTGTATGPSAGTAQMPNNPAALMGAGGGVDAAPLAAPQWQLAGLGDFNGDGLADGLMVRDDGLLSVGTINGDAATTLGQLAAGWSIAGIGDINDDGTSDILLKHENGSYQADLIHDNAVAATVDLEMVDGQLRAIDPSVAAETETPPAADPVVPVTADPTPSEPVTPIVNDGVLSEAELAFFVDAAIARWTAAGLTEAQIDALEAMDFSVADLSSLNLGSHSPAHITIDADAAGWGWYLDATPMDDSEFGNLLSATRMQTDPTLAPAGKYDLLTTIMHEMGHSLGLGDSYAGDIGLMHGYLYLGERRLAAAGEADGAVAGSLTGNDFLASPINIGVLPASKSVTIQWQATVDDQHDKLVTNPVNQGTVTSSLPPVQTNSETLTLDSLTLGNLVFNDVNANGVFDAGTDAGVDGVALTLFADTNDNNAFDAGIDTQVDTKTTAGGGLYSFTGLAAGNYIVRVDAANFAAGGALAGLPTSSGTSSDADTNATDGDNNGTRAPGAAGYSKAITLSFNQEPTAGTGNDTNNTLDFAFKADAPPMVTAGNTVAYIEQQAGTVLNPALTISDDFGTIASASVVINGFTSGDALSFDTALAASFGITGSMFAVTLSFSGNASVANYEALLRTVAFSSASNDPTGSNLTRGIAWTVNDGTQNNAIAATTLVNVTPINDAPTLTSTGSNPAFTEGAGSGQGAAVAVFNGTVASTIEANQTFTSLTFTVSGLLDGANEKVAVGGFVIGLGTNSSDSVSVPGMSYTATVSGGVATITIDTTLPVDAVALAGVINALTYQNTNTNNPTPGDRVFTLTSVTDSGGTANTGVAATALAIASTVHVTAVNDAPVATIAIAPYNATEDIALVLKGTGISIADVDAGSGIMTATLTVTEGSLSVTEGDSGVTVVSDNSGSAVVVSGTLGQLNALLAAGGTSNLVYLNATDAPAAVVTMSLLVDDAGNTGGSAPSGYSASSIFITPDNDAPVATITPTSYDGQPGAALDLKNSGLSVADPDAGSGSVTVTLWVDHGTLAVTAGTSGAGVAGTGTATVTLTGTLAQIDALLNTDGTSTVSFTGTDAVNTLTLAISDNGHTGGGTLTGSDTAQILLDEPPAVAGAGSSVGYTEQAPGTPLGAALLVSDTDSANLNGATVTIAAPVAGDVLAAVTTGTSIVATYAGGALSLTGSDTVAHYQAVLRSVTFASTGDDPTSLGAATTRTITWSVRDNYDVASTPVTTIINVTAVNDAPTALITPASYIATEQTALDLKAGGMAIGDPDAGPAAVVTATLSVGTGVLTVTTGGSGAIVANSGTSSVTITGTQAQINALLNSDATSTVSYINDSDAPPDSTPLTLTINDGGNSGTGGARSASDTAVITSGGIGPSGIDDAPTGLDLANELTTLSETASTSSARKVADIVLIDPDGNTTLSLSGEDSFRFIIVGNELFLKAGAHLDFEKNPKLDVTVSADGAGAHLTSSMTISLLDVAETITGTKKSEKISGTSQSETIEGRGGNDTIKGNAGNDTIIGGKGADVMTGGTGEDVFKFRSGDMPKLGVLDQTFGAFFGKYDVISDFKPGTDTIDLSSIDANTHKNGNQAFHFEGRHSLSNSRGEVVYRFGEDGKGDRSTIVLGDINGDGSADFRIVLKGHHALHESDFIL